MSAATALATRGPVARRVPFGEAEGVHANGRADAATRPNTGAPPLPDSPTGRRFAELAGCLRKAAQIAESLAQEHENQLAGRADQSVMESVSEPKETTRGTQDSQGGELLLTPADLAEMLRLDVRTVRRWRKNGLLPVGIELGGVLRWRRITIEAWLEGKEDAA